MDHIIHEVSNPGDWPERVAPLARALSHSFPPWLATGPYPALSGFAQGSLSLLQQQLQCHISATSSEHIESADSELQKLDAMFDFILSISTLVREIASSPSQADCARQLARALWVLFATTIWRSISNDLSIYHEVGFVKPRARQPVNRPLAEGDVDGNATLVLSHVVMPAVTSPLPQASEDPDMGTPWDEDKVCLSSDSSPQATPIEVPLDAHILTRTGVWYFAELPVFVIADPDNITELLSGMVYQRHVWGIDEPAIGLVLSRSGKIGRIVFSWIDTSGASSTDLPLVHFASADDGCQTGSPLGIFDLSTPLDAFAFAQFVFQLRNHHRMIAGASIPAACGCTSFSWRLDLAVGDGLFGEQWRYRIERWRQAVDRNHGDFVKESSSPSPLVSPSFGSQETADMDKGKSATGTRSNSVVSKKPDNDLGSTNSISNWLMEHNVLTLSRVEVAHFPDLQDSNQKIALYDRLTAEGWIQGWRELDDLPKGMSADHLALREQIYTSMTPDMEALPDDFANTMTSYFPFVLLAADGACVRDTTSVHYGANEADRRHVWDALLIWFTGVDSLREGHRVYDVHFERMLNAPRNPTADRQVSSDEIYKDFQDWAAKNTRFASLMASSLNDPPSVDSGGPPSEYIHLRMQLRAVVAQADCMQYNLWSRRAAHEDFVQTVKDHIAEQPKQAICDAVFVAAVPELFKNDTPDSRTSSDNTPNPLHVQLRLVQRPAADSSEAAWRSPHYQFRNQVTALRESAVKKTQSSTQHLPTMPKSKKASSSLNVPKIDLKHPNNGEKQLLRDSFIHYHPSEPTKPTKTNNKGSVPKSDDLLLPILVAEYKKKDDTAMYQAMNQCRSYLVSSLCFLHALGLGDEPVFGLVVSGQRGIITMAWRDDKRMYVMECNCRSYDVTDPMSVFQFAIVLLRLVKRREALKKKFEQKRKELEDAIKLGQGPKYQSLWWSKEAQLSETRAEGTTVDIQA